MQQKPYPMPRSQEAVVEKEIQRMVDLDTIQESQSGWSSSVISLEPKREGSMRFCIDSRELNKVSKFEA